MKLGTGQVSRGDSGWLDSRAPSWAPPCCRKPSTPTDGFLTPLLSLPWQRVLVSVPFSLHLESRVGAIFPREACRTTTCLTLTIPSWSATCFYYLYSERPVGSLGPGVKSIITGLQQERCSYHTNCLMFINLVLFPCAHHRHCLSWW